MYETLIQKIKASLIATTGVASFSNVPGANITSYPHVFFKPDGFSNEFHTGQENETVYNFLMIVLVSAEGTGGSAEKAFTEVLPSVVDNIIEKFNADWDQGVIDGHRVRVLIDSAASWQLSEEDKGLVAYAPLSLQIKLLVNV